MATEFSGVSFQPGYPVPDFVVTSADGILQLLVEVKARMPASASAENSWPAELRREFGQFDSFFLLITPERMLLFLPANPVCEQDIVEQETSAVLASFLDVSRFPLVQLGGMELEAVVRSWLGSVMFKPADVLLADPAQAWLVDSGLHTRIYRGYINQAQAVA